MDPRLRAYFQRLKAHRLVSTLTVVATLALGILIGTVASHTGKGKALAGFSSDDATPLATPSPKQLSSTFATIAKTIEPSVVNINGSGRARAHKVGSVTIKAVLGSTNATTTLTVTH